MFNLEAYRYKSGSGGPATVPDASWNQGRFLQPADADDFAGRHLSGSPTIRLHDLYSRTLPAVSGNIIPMSRIDSVVQKAMAFFPRLRTTRFTTIS